MVQILNKDNLPLDTRLLSEAIYELNISRHNVSIYPRNHPIVEESLNKAYSFLLKLFELRDEVTIAVAKDTLIIDDNYLDRQNPVFMDFACCLNKNNIASLSFVSGLTKAELFSLHKFLLEETENASSEQIENILKEYKFRHVNIVLIDYSAFSFKDGNPDNSKKEMPLWDKYIYGLLEGNLATEFVQDMAPEQLAAAINSYDITEIGNTCYDNVITSYIKSSRERAFSGSDLKKLMDFVDALRPELKSQFLSSSIRNILDNTDMANKVLKEMPIDDVLNLLDHINNQLIVIPEALRNVLENFSKIDRDILDVTQFGNGLIEDDILLSPEVTSLLREADFAAYVSDAYQEQILKILSFDAKNDKIEWLNNFDHEWKDESVEVVLHQIMLELISSDRDGIIPKDEYSIYFDALREQTTQLIDIGQFKKVFHAITVMDAVRAEHPDLAEAQEIVEYFHSDAFMALLIDSFRVARRELRDDAALLCEYFSDSIIPLLMDALIEEPSLTVRRFLLSLLRGFGDRVMPEALKRLKDERWFVKRNMLYIVSGCINEESLARIRPYCDNEHPKVRFEAMKCLLKVKDSYGVHSLKKTLIGKSRELVKQAISLSGAYRVHEVVPDLIRLLKTKELSSRDYEDKVHVARALGQIGDPRTIEVFNAILSSRKFLFKSAANKLKEEISSILQNTFSQKGKARFEKAGKEQ